MNTSSYTDICLAVRHKADNFNKLKNICSKEVGEKMKVGICKCKCSRSVSFIGMGLRYYSSFTFIIQPLNPIADAKSQSNFCF
jgi:hypothetical protein